MNICSVWHKNLIQERDTVIVNILKTMMVLDTRNKIFEKFHPAAF